MRIISFFIIVTLNLFFSYLSFADVSEETADNFIIRTTMQLNLGQYNVIPETPNIFFTVKINNFFDKHYVIHMHDIGIAKAFITAKGYPDKNICELLFTQHDTGFHHNLVNIEIIQLFDPTIKCTLSYSHSILIESRTSNEKN